MLTEGRFAAGIVWISRLTSAAIVAHVLWSCIIIWGHGPNGCADSLLPVVVLINCLFCLSYYAGTAATVVGFVLGLFSHEEERSAVIRLTVLLVWYAQYSGVWILCSD